MGILALMFTIIFITVNRALMSPFEMGIMILLSVLMIQIGLLIINVYSKKEKDE